MQVTVGVSNRHVHLTEDTYKYLFDGKEIEKRNDLNQIGEFASTDTIDLEYNGKKLEHVRVLGPFRNKNQIELLERDIKYLEIDAPTRKSGYLDDTPSITLIKGSKILKTDGVIRAQRHVHVPKSMEQKLNLYDDDEVYISTPKCKFNAYVKVSDNAYFEVHIDKDEAEYYGIENGQEVEMYHVENR